MFTSPDPESGKVRSGDFILNIHRHGVQNSPMTDVLVVHYQLVNARSGLVSKAAKR